MNPDNTVEARRGIGMRYANVVAIITFDKLLVWYNYNPKELDTEPMYVHPLKRQIPVLNTKNIQAL